MALTRQHYTVSLNQPDGTRVEHQVDVGPGDQLKAEQTGVRRGLLPHGIAANALTFGSLCVYFALVRLELYTGKWEQFVDHDCYQFEAATNEDGETSERVDPTTSAAPPPSGSPSAPGSPEPPTGSTPT